MPWWGNGAVFPRKAPRKLFPCGVPFNTISPRLGAVPLLPDTFGLRPATLTPASPRFITLALQQERDAAETASTVASIDVCPLGPVVALLATGLGGGRAVQSAALTARPSSLNSSSTRSSSGTKSVLRLHNM